MSLEGEAINMLVWSRQFQQKHRARPASSSGDSLVCGNTSVAIPFKFNIRLD